MTTRALIRLVRLPNLIILGATIWVTLKALIYPSLINHQLLSVLTNKEILLLIFIAICLGAGTYVHNDMVDVVSDQGNDKRDTVESKISRTMGWAMYILLTLTPIPFMLSFALELDRLD